MGAVTKLSRKLGLISDLSLVAAGERSGGVAAKLLRGEKMKRFFLVPVVAILVACGGGDPKDDISLDALDVLTDSTLDISGDEGEDSSEGIDIADVEDVDVDVLEDASDEGDEGEDQINVEVIPLDPGMDSGEFEEVQDPGIDPGLDDPGVDLGQEDLGSTDPGPSDPGSDLGQVDSGPEIVPECLNAEDCNDGNDCMASSCVGGICQYDPLEGLCNDGDLCTEDDRCFEGECRGEPISGCCAADSECNDDRSCTHDSCNMATNRCANDECVEASAPSRCTLTPGVCVEASDVCVFARTDKLLCPPEYPDCTLITEWGGLSTCCKAAVGYPGGMCCLEEVPSRGLKKCLD